MLDLSKHDQTQTESKETVNVSKIASAVAPTQQQNTQYDAVSSQPGATSPEVTTPADLFVMQQDSTEFNMAQDSE